MARKRVEMVSIRTNHTGLSHSSGRPMSRFITSVSHNGDGDFRHLKRVHCDYMILCLDLLMRVVFRLPHVTIVCYDFGVYTEGHITIMAMESELFRCR